MYILETKGNFTTLRRTVRLRKTHWCIVASVIMVHSPNCYSKIIYFVTSSLFQGKYNVATVASTLSSSVSISGLPRGFYPNARALSEAHCELLHLYLGIDHPMSTVSLGT